jgi:hypothetical protein
MKNLLITFLLLCSMSSFSQPTVGLELGGVAFADRNPMMYLDKTTSPGGYLGLNVAFPLFNQKAALETGIHFYDHYYRLLGPEFKVWFTDDRGSSFDIMKKINLFGLSVPLSFVWKQYRLQPFCGIEVQRSILSRDIIKIKLGGHIHGNPVTFWARGEDLVDISEFNWFMSGGFYFVCSSKLKVKVEYARGMNDFATHRISPKIINGENVGGTSVHTSPIDKVQVGLVYNPQWKRNPKDKNTENANIEVRPKRTFKEIIQSIYK